MSSFNTDRTPNPVGESAPVDDQMGSFGDDMDAGRRQLDAYGIQVSTYKKYDSCVVFFNANINPQRSVHSTR